MLPWWTDALNELRAHVRATHLQPTGPAGGIFDESLYQQEPGQATVFIPVSEVRAESARIRSAQVPAAELIVTIHHGSTADIDLAYADLGTYLAEHDIHVGHQIREHYLCDRSDTPDTTRWQTEIAWPAISSS